MVLQKLFKILVKNLSGSGLGKYPIITNAYFKISKKLLPEFILFDGQKIFLDSETSVHHAMLGFAIGSPLRILTSTGIKMFGKEIQGVRVRPRFR